METREYQDNQEEQEKKGYQNYKINFVRIIMDLENKILHVDFIILNQIEDIKIMHKYFQKNNQHTELETGVMNVFYVIFKI
jgi:hypothetical protein